jgi:hypothetical protein
VRDPELLRELHVLWRGSCVLDELGDCDVARYSLHHVHRHPRDDEEANLVMLCGDGTRGHHGRIEAHDRATCVRLAAYLIRERLDTMAYLGEKLGGVVAAREWLCSQLYAPV